jgi:sugar lactone lactonase YvrE
VAVSPDGKSVYAAGGPGVVRFNRNTTTGAITQPAGTAGCIVEYGNVPSCADGNSLLDSNGLAVSPDGKTIYSASRSIDAVARLNRNTTTGAITQPAGTAGGCVSEDGSGGTLGPCANGHGLYGTTGVAVSPDGKNVYVTSYGSSNAVVRFNRAP